MLVHTDGCALTVSRRPSSVRGSGYCLYWSSASPQKRGMLQKPALSVHTREAARRERPASAGAAPRGVDVTRMQDSSHAAMTSTTDEIDDVVSISAKDLERLKQSIESESAARQSLQAEVDQLKQLLSEAMGKLEVYDGVLGFQHACKEVCNRCNNQQRPAVSFPNLGMSIEARAESNEGTESCIAGRATELKYKDRMEIDQEHCGRNNHVQVRAVMSSADCSTNPLLPRHLAGWNDAHQLQPSSESRAVLPTAEVVPLVTSLYAYASCCRLCFCHEWCCSLRRVWALPSNMREPQDDRYPNNGDPVELPRPTLP